MRRGGKYPSCGRKANEIKKLCKAAIKSGNNTVSKKCIKGIDVTAGYCMIEGAIAEENRHK